MRSRIVYSAAAALTVVAAFSGCGGGGHSSSTTTRTTTTAAAAPTTTTALGKGAYVAEMRALGKTIGAEFNRIYPIDSGLRGSATEKATMKRLEHGEAVFGQVLATVRGIHPPAPVASDQRQLERGLAGVAAELGQVVKALQAGDISATIVPSRLSDISLVMSATADMEKRGFDVLGTKAG
jgi:hypothetical protein